MIKSFRRSKRLLNLLLTSLPKHLILRVLLASHEAADFVNSSPTKVIKALYDYRPQGPKELQFEKGDFFHVLEAPLEVDQHGWYEATNPMTNQRGMVPKLYFEVFNRSGHQSQAGTLGSQRVSGGSVLAAPSQPYDIGQGSLHNIQQQTIQNLQQNGPQARENRTLYAVTLFDFRAEREDELDIVPGEHLVICAHHDYEWFIAKPINRLGGPGLVPASYVKIVDKYNPLAQMDAGNDMVSVITHFRIPTVEEWKELTAIYQASTHPTGTGSTVPSQNSDSRSSSTSTSTYITDASVDSYHLAPLEDNSRYQYVVTARTLTGKTRQLCRFYEDFYNMQVKILEQFPHEAGKVEGHRRTIPGFPGPVIHVSDNISSLRRERFDYYLRNLIAMPANVSRCEEVLSLFEVQNNGFDKEFTEKDRSLKPIKQQLGYQQDRLSQYLNVQPVLRSRSSNTPSLELNRAENRTLDTRALEAEKLPKVKVKFYYEDDIFVLLLPMNLRLQDLKAKLARRLGLDTDYDADPSGLVFLFLKSEYDDFMDTNQIASEVLSEEQRALLFQKEINEDAAFHEVLYDKCKIVILSG